MVYTRSQGGLNKVILDVISEVTKWTVLAEKHERRPRTEGFRENLGSGNAE